MTTLRRRWEAISVREVDREVLLLDMASEQIHQFNETASFIWQRLEEAASAEEIARLLAIEYDVQVDVAKRDVEQTLSQFRSLNLVIETKGSQALDVQVASTVHSS